jgi:hypothetical protein
MFTKLQRKINKSKIYEAIKFSPPIRHISYLKGEEFIVFAFQPPDVAGSLRVVLHEVTAKALN